MYRYKVTEQYGAGKENPVAQFKTEKDARLFFEAKLAADTMGVKVIVRLLDMDDLLAEQEPGQQSASASSQSSQGGQGQSSTSSFRPTPLNTTPMPKGMPQKWLKDDEDEKK